jgi:hypothetical protein
MTRYTVKEYLREIRNLLSDLDRCDEHDHLAVEHLKQKAHHQIPHLDEVMYYVENADDRPPGQVTEARQ